MTDAETPGGSGDGVEDDGAHTDGGGAEPDVLVLRSTVHGIPIEELLDAVEAVAPGRRVRLARTAAEEDALLPHARVVVGYRLSPEQVAAASDLELFACVFAGVGHLDLDAFRDAGVAVTNASGVHAPNVSEYVLAQLVAGLRRFRRAWRQGDRAEWRKYDVRELHGSTVLVVGQGAIGEAVVDRLNAFGVETLAVRHTPAKGGPADETFGYDAFEAALARTDHLVLACPLTDETRGLVDREALRSLPVDAHVVNVARGPVVDTDALVDALRSNDLAGAALDVTDPEPLPADHPLWRFDNVTVTPHNAGATPDYYERLADVLGDNLEALDGGGTLRNRVA
jgi:phosphoglycerate dehydrogenase-like enzyme